MSENSIVRNSFEKIGTECVVTSASLLSRSSTLRKVTINGMNLYLNRVRKPGNGSDYPPGVVDDRGKFANVIQHTADRFLSHNYSKTVIRSMWKNLVSGIMVEPSDHEKTQLFKEKYGTTPPSFLVLSPGKACNLHCTGCYANAGENAEALSWTTFDRIITEAKELWGVRFIVISGGEPLAYRSEGKGLLDAVEKHPDIFFLMYTNGTLIDDEMAARISKLGNLTPAISVEGWKERTDERRGAGIFEKILDAMECLRNAGVPFGISLTATCNNAEEIFSDEFIDYFFEEQGAIYGWLFQYMPIGRSYTLDLMPTPEQRVKMWKRIWQINDERHLFLADFWNHGTLSDGCLAAGRSNGGGYFYIDWNGAISPCVFVPYSPANIKEIYAKGGNLNDIWEVPFFAGIRGWQGDYRKKKGNWLSPCIIRDHNQDLRNLIIQHEPDPTDENARMALLDPEYARGMAKYDEEYQSLTSPIWNKNYLRSGSLK